MHNKWNMEFWIFDWLRKYRRKAVLFIVTNWGRDCITYLQKYIIGVQEPKLFKTCKYVMQSIHPYIKISNSINPDVCEVVKGPIKFVSYGVKDSSIGHLVRGKTSLPILEYHKIDSSSS